MAQSANNFAPRNTSCEGIDNHTCRLVCNNQPCTRSRQGYRFEFPCCLLVELPKDTAVKVLDMLSTLIESASNPEHDFFRVSVMTEAYCRRLRSLHKTPQLTELITPRAIAVNLQVLSIRPWTRARSSEFESDVVHAVCALTGMIYASRNSSRATSACPSEAKAVDEIASLLEKYGTFPGHQNDTNRCAGR